MDNATYLYNHDMIIYTYHTSVYIYIVLCIYFGASQATFQAGSPEDVQAILLPGGKTLNAPSDSPGRRSTPLLFSLDAVAGLGRRHGRWGRRGRGDGGMSMLDLYLGLDYVGACGSYL